MPGLAGVKSWSNLPLYLVPLDKNEELDKPVARCKTVKQKERAFSQRELALIHQFLLTTLQTSFSFPDPDAYQCVYAAFLSVHRKDPTAFYGLAGQGWQKAAARIQDALKAEKRSKSFWQYRCSSLNQPTQAECPIPAIDRFPSHHGDFQNSVGFHDYLHRMDPDVRKLAYGLIAGYTTEELCTRYRWSPGLTQLLFAELKEHMEIYERI